LVVSFRSLRFLKNADTQSSHPFGEIMDQLVPAILRPNESRLERARTTEEATHIFSLY
jgi:hypothetical protein